MREAVMQFGMFVGLGIALSTSASPYQLPTTPTGSWTPSGITSGTVTFGTGTLAVETGTYYKTTPSGLRMTVTVDGTFPPGSGSFFLAPGNTDLTSMTPSAAGTSPGPFTTTPLLPSGANSLWMGTSVVRCKTTVPTSTTCSGIGTVKVSFTDPLGGAVAVSQPKIHVTKVGGTVGAMEIGTGWQTNSTGLALAGANSATLNIRNGNEFFGNPSAPGTTLNVNCGVSATTTAGCGTVQVTGTASVLDFTVNAYRTTAGANAWGDGADGFFFDMTFDEDYGSLPASYEGGGLVASNLLTNLRLGSTVSAENATAAAHANGGINATGMFTTSPAAIASGAAPTDSADGIVFPTLTTAMGGTTYTVTPTISGATRAGVVCGWIDFDKSGTFAPATEGVCQSFAVGATSVPMNFTIANTNFAAGPVYARFRTTFDTAMTISSFNGLFSSGETEDYQIHVKPVVKVNKVVNPTADTGTFNLLVNSTQLASAISNGGTTGDRTVYHTNSPDVTVATNITTAPITGIAITETGAGATVLADYTTTSSCVDANSATVATGGTPAAPTFSIPQSSGNNAKAQTITCTLTNTKIPKLKLQKSTIGGFGGPFTFAQTNLASTPAGISTTAANTATPAAPTAIEITTIGTAVTVTETLVAGYVLKSAICTDAASAITGNTGSFGTLAGNVLTIPAANILAGVDLTCVFTNSKLPTLTLRKTTTGGIDTFAFSGTNGFGTDSIATVVAGTPVAGVLKTLSAAATVTEITETVTSGYFLAAAPTCTGMGAGGTVTLVSGSTYQLDAAATADGSNIVCTFTNTLAAPQLAITKTASVANINASGNVITYTITVSNPGNVTITSITVSDPLGTVICAASGNATIASLAPAASENCTVAYTVPQSVIDDNGGGDGTIDNTATASGNYNGTSVSVNDSEAVSITRTPLLNIVKTASTSTPQPVGAVITYTYVVTNSGNVTMTGVAVSDVHNGGGVLVGPTNETLTTDTAPAGDSTDPAVNGTWATLAPGDVVTFTATYTVTQHDVDFLQ